MKDVIVRKAIPDDMDSILTLFKSLVTMEPDFEYHLRKHRAGFGAMMADSKRCRVLVAEMAGKVSGLCTAQLLYSSAMGGFIALIENFVVADAFRGQGLGQQLLEILEQWAKKRGALRFDLQVDQNNAHARSFYETNGWVETNLASYFKYPSL